MLPPGGRPWGTLLAAAWVRAEIHDPHRLNSANNYEPLKHILGIFDHSLEERDAKIVIGSATISTGSPV